MLYHVIAWIIGVGMVVGLMMALTGSATNPVYNHLQFSHHNKKP
jgi:hypothetical protein